MTRVVVIEDDTLLAGHFDRVLTKAGCEVTTISHAMGALDLIDEFQPDVIVIDMLLIGSTAMPLLNEMRTHDDLVALPIVMVTSAADDLSLKTLAPYGVKVLLDKATIFPDDLVAAIKKVSDT